MTRRKTLATKDKGAGKENPLSRKVNIIVTTQSFVIKNQLSNRLRFSHPELEEEDSMQSQPGINVKVRI